MRALYVIIPVYNTEQYLRRCVDSVLVQTYGMVRVILVDDGSADGSPGICDDYAREYPAVRVIHQENKGLSEARNAGVRLAFQTASANDYISFIDSDDFVHPAFAEKMIGLCEKFGCDTAQCGYEKGYASVFPKQVQKKHRVYAEDSETALLGYGLRSFVCNKIYTCAAFNGILFPQGVWNEDEFTTYRAVYHGKKVAFTDEKLYYYFQRSGSIMDNIAKKLKGNPHRHDWLHAYEERIRFFETEGKTQQVLRTREKICTDIILRYSEQMLLHAEERDTDCTGGTYLDIYKENYKSMIKRRGIPIKRRLIYFIFRIAPYSAALIGYIHMLRK